MSARSPRLCLVLGIGSALSACGGPEKPPAAVDSADGPHVLEQEPGTFRAVFISDTHVIGPEYVCCSESPGIDNESIMKTPDRLAQVVAQINRIEPPPELVFVLGDVVHNTLVLDTVDEYAEVETGFLRARQLFDGLDAPVHFVWGNHDYEVHCDPRPEDKSRELAHQVFSQIMGGAPTGVVQHKGWRFVLANSQLGPTWEPGNPLCDTDLASYGREQLAWIDAELAKGDPTFVLAHYMMAVTAREEDPGAPNPSLRAVLERHSNLALFLVGHTHRWIDLRETEAFPHMVLGAARYDDDNFMVFDFNVGAPGYTIPDYDKAGWMGVCAEGWRYDGEVAPDPSAGPEDGDCGR